MGVKTYQEKNTNPTKKELAQSDTPVKRNFWTVKKLVTLDSRVASHSSQKVQTNPGGTSELLVSCTLNPRPNGGCATLSRICPLRRTVSPLAKYDVHVSVFAFVAAVQCDTVVLLTVQQCLLTGLYLPLCPYFYLYLCQCCRVSEQCLEWRRARSVTRVAGPPALWFLFSLI